MAATVWWATRGVGGFWRLLLRRSIVYALPTIPWVLWNIKQYHWVLPRDLAAPATPNHFSLVSHWFVEMEHAATQMALGLW
ncbi:hypothetical protein, partial [Pseudomonas sp. Pseusp97]|uniref:hypothetical protein n=1 Tax=Pseudomonas sp. Pseusp97 TaxID=3243065 RepID=UPI0039A5BD1B